MAAVTEPFRPAPPTLEGVRDPIEEDVYPNDVLEGCETALVLFCARWYGRQDAFWIAEAGLTATCVDIDGERLEGMRGIYPPDWEFCRWDCFDFAEQAFNRHHLRGLPLWDVVSLDPFTNLFDRCAESVNLWCSLARHAVILGSGATTSVTAPAGWRITQIQKRSDYDNGVYWTVLQKTEGRE